MIDDNERPRGRAQDRVGPSGPRARFKWHHIYYLLAVFDLATVSLSLLLTHQILGIYRESVGENQSWTARSDRFGDLAQLSSAVNAPGNNVFESRDAAQESSRLEAALSEFSQAVARTRSDLTNHVDDEVAAPLSAALDRTQFAMTAMADEARFIFRHFQKEPEIAGRHMAAMDRRYAEVRYSLDEVQRGVHAIQTQNLQRQTAAAASLGRYEYVVALFIILMVAAITGYGTRLARKIEADQRQRDRYLANLREADARNRAILENAAEGIMTIDAHGTIEEVNPAAEEIFGYTAAELIDQNVSILMPMPDSADHDAYISRYASGGEPHIIGLGGREVLAKNKDGTIFPLELSVSEVRRGEAIRCFTGMLHDITERKHTEELIRRYNEELETTVRERTGGLELALKKQSELANSNAEAFEVIRLTQQELVRSERLAAVGELSAAVAHGLRNPLASIRACAQVERSEMAGENSVAETLDGIVGEVDRLEGRIRAVLDFARPFEPAGVPIDLNAAVGVLAEDSRKRAPERVEIEVDLDPDLPAAPFDAAYLYEILEALAINALEAMNGRGKLTLRTRLDRRDELRPVSVVSISDTGPGIEASRLSHIFELFYTSKPSGTGIGLAIAKRIVESQGGSIEVKTQPGEGSEFSVGIPVPPPGEQGTS
jgi:two-component system sensor kinase FixL